MTDNIDKLKGAFIENVGVPSDTDWQKLAYGSTPGWDSVAHMALISGIENALDALCQDSILRSRIANNAPELIVKKQLTWRQHARKVVALFERIDTAGAARNRQTSELLD